MNFGRLSSAALCASGVAGIAVPQDFLKALDLAATSPRGIAETRLGLGGTFAGLGGWALLSGAPAAHRAVGMTWLGAAAVRMASVKIDRPRTDWTYWAYLTGELGLGSASMIASFRRRRG
ncbi:MAG: hypothetical protein M3O28_12610 [Actinomycetota bacterium]|nr:hypothetical protein [Actinomycetota bacterium]